MAELTSFDSFYYGANSSGGEGMSDNMRSCASCTDEMITFNAEHDDDQATTGDASASGGGGHGGAVGGTVSGVSTRAGGRNEYGIPNRGGSTASASAAVGRRRNTDRSATIGVEESGSPTMIGAVDAAGDGTQGSSSRRGTTGRRKRFTRLRPNSSFVNEESREERQRYSKEKKMYTQRVQEYIRSNDYDKMNGWLKFRCAVFHKMWIKFFCVLKPGFLVVYKNQNMQRRVGWVGTILLSSVYIIERPTQREGYCFKLIHCLNKSLWVNKGPKKLQPVGNLKGLNLPLTSVIIRADTEENGKKWLEAMKSMCASFFYDFIPPTTSGCDPQSVITDFEVESTPSQSTSSDEGEDVENGQEGGDEGVTTNSHDVMLVDESACSVQIHEETMYIPDNEEPLPHLNTLNNKSSGNQIGNGKLDILFGLARQIKPNQPLSRIVIPPFVNYPRSFLDKLQDMFYRVDLIAEMSNAPSPKERMEIFAKFMLWLQNFHPTRDMKKYYNSVLGEKSRCYFEHPNGSRTHFIAEEVTHHPPASAIYCVNKQEGFHIKVLMEFEIRFHGYYVRTNVRGRLEATLEKLGEVYTASFPDLMVLNIFFGQFRIDFEGPCTLACEQTGYTCEIENKTRWTPIGRENQFHRIRARLYDDKKQELLQAEGHWNNAVYTKSANGKEKEKLFWKADKSQLLAKYVVHQQDLDEYESNRLWCGLTEALLRGEEEEAIEQKTLVEQRQRELRADRERTGVVYQPAFMEKDENDAHDTKIFNYKYHSEALWDPKSDDHQYEHNFVIKTHKKNTLPSIASISLPVGMIPDENADFEVVGSSAMAGPVCSTVKKQTSNQRVDHLLTETMQAQMNQIHRDLQTVQEELRKITKDNASKRRLTESKDGLNRTHRRSSRSGGLSCSSIMFCFFFVVLCVFFTYYKDSITSIAQRVFNDS